MSASACPARVYDDFHRCRWPLLFFFLLIRVRVLRTQAVFCITRIKQKEKNTRDLPLLSRNRNYEDQAQTTCCIRT